MHARYDEGEGTAVVLLHGQPGSASDWARVVPLLRDHKLRVLSVDRPGYGSDRGLAQDWRGNAHQLVELLDGRGIDDAVLVAWSWGGGVVLQAALECPSRVRGMVLLGSVGHPEAIGTADRILAWHGIRRVLPLLMGRAGRRGARLVGATSGSVLDPVALAYYEEETALWEASDAWGAFAAEQYWMVRDARTLGAALPSIRTPATLLHGWHDLVVPLRAAGALATALPNARLEVLDAGHLLPFECPGDVARVILDTVASTMPNPAG